jgi:hypothetical protein
LAYEKERLENALAYIAIIHKKLTNKPAYQTYIYKYLALIDFTEVKETGRTMFDLDYIALTNGPVPRVLYDNREENLRNQPFRDTVVLKKTSEQQIIYEPVAEPNLEFFSDHELDLIESTLEKYASRDITCDKICEITHRQIPAWRKAWNRRNTSQRVPINPLDSFPDVLEKDINARTPIEEAAVQHFMIKAI